MRELIFRVDSSTQIGSGHLMRCLTLANQLKDKYKIVFISRDLEGNLSELVKKNGFELICLSRVTVESDLQGYEQWLTVSQEVDAEETKSIIKNYKAKALIVDSYALDEKWEKVIRPYVEKIMVIDDLANRKHDCDILLDQNYGAEANGKYNGLVPRSCRTYLGTRYVLLRNEFYQERKNLRLRDGVIRNILIFFGGSDDTNETQKVIEALQLVEISDIEVNVIVGGSNILKSEIKNMCKSRGFHYYCQVSTMAELIHKADLAFGAAGSNTWERCFLGLPAIVTVTENNQRCVAEATAITGAMYNLGDCDHLDKFSYLRAFKHMNPELLKTMSQRSLDLIPTEKTSQDISTLLD